MMCQCAAPLGNADVFNADVLYAPLACPVVIDLARAFFVDAASSSGEDVTSNGIAGARAGAG